MLKRSLASGLMALMALCTGAAPSSAASLQVAPIRLSIPAPGSASKITLRNTGQDQINAQVRIFKWTQVKGKDTLTETRDVVASPPIVKLDAGKSNVIRIVRTAKAQVQGEESYRLIVDELPPAKGATGLSIKFVLRYSIPVFFNSAQQKGADLSWSVSTKGGQTVLTAANTGDSHLRISGLSMTPAGGKTVSFGQGLVGYVLAKSTARFTLKQALKGASTGSTVEITAEGNDGPVKATAEVRAAN